MSKRIMISDIYTPGYSRADIAHIEPGHTVARAADGSGCNLRSIRSAQSRLDQSRTRSATLDSRALTELAHPGVARQQRARRND